MIKLPASMKDLDLMARGKTLPFWKIQESMKAAHERRKEHRFAKNGWTMNKGRTMLIQSRMSVAEYLMYKDRYFPDNADIHEKNKLQEEFMKNHPECNARDK